MVGSCSSGGCGGDGEWRREGVSVVVVVVVIVMEKSDSYVGGSRE